MATDLISQREFARRIGINERKVRYCIAKGKLSKCVKYDEDNKPQIVYSIGIVEAEDLGLIKLKSEKPTKSVRSQKGNLNDQSMVPVNENTDTISDVSLNATFAEAARMEKIFKARSAGIEAKVLAGKYMNVEDVNYQLRGLGLLIKGKLENITFRETDNLISKANNRDNFMKYLSKIIFDVLTDLSLTLEKK